MPLPLFVIGASIFSGLALIDSYKKSLHKQDINRSINDFKQSDKIIGREPSELLPSAMSHVLMPGAIVCCHVYGAIEHTGIVIEDNLIVELHGDGLVKAVSEKRFLNNRSGSHLFIACDQQGVAFNYPVASNRACNEIFQFYDYNLLSQNCYSHTWFCLSGKREKITNFSEFNKKLFSLTAHKIHWDRVS